MIFLSQNGNMPLKMPSHTKITSGHFRTGSNHSSLSMLPGLKFSPSLLQQLTPLLSSVPIPSPHLGALTDLSLRTRLKACCIWLHHHSCISGCNSRDCTSLPCTTTPYILMPDSVSLHFSPLFMEVPERPETRLFILVKTSSLETNHTYYY